MISLMKKVITSLVFILVSLSTVAFADTVSLPVGQQSHQAITTPEKGKSMEQVEADFGVPLEKSAPIGEPPITKWHYQKFTVYFEADIVIHSVIHHSK